MKPAVACTAGIAVRVLLRWRAAMGVPRVRVSDTALHIKNRALRLVAERLGTTYHFAVANSAWTKGTVERLLREIIRTFTAVLVILSPTEYKWSRSYSGCSMLPIVRG